MTSKRPYLHANLRGTHFRWLSIPFAILMLFSLTVHLSAPARAKTLLTTCIDLATLKERISKNGTCRTPQEAVANWRIVPDDSALAIGSTTKSLIICSNKEGSPFTYQLIRAKCAKHMQTNRYTRSAFLPAKPVITRVISLSHESASLTLAADSATSTDAPITYYTITSSKGEVKRVHSWKDLTLTISGLRSSTSYTFTVSATNADGTSPLSAASLPVTTQIYTAPAPTAAPALSCADGGTCAVGDRGPGGGVIFFEVVTPFACGPSLNLTCRYLEAAPNGWNGGIDPLTPWSDDVNMATEVSGIGESIGMGYRNTRAIVAQGNPTSAAALSDAYTVTVGSTVVNDWYLPSNKELEQLVGQSTVVGGFQSDLYWASYQIGADFGWSIQFPVGTQAYYFKETLARVRPIRAF